MIGRRHFIQTSLLLAATGIMASRGEAKPDAPKPAAQPDKSSPVIPQQTGTPDFWMDDKVVKPNVRSALEQTSKASGLVRTWLFLNQEQSVPAALANVAPDGTYRTSIGVSRIVVGKYQSKTVEAAVYAVAKRYGRLLLGFGATEDGVPGAKMFWIGYDAAGPSASMLDKFLSSLHPATAASLQLGKLALAAFPDDLEVNVRYAEAAKAMGDEAAVKAIKAKLDSVRVSPPKFKDMLLPAIRSGNKASIDCLNDTIAHRRFLGASLQKL